MRHRQPKAVGLVAVGVLSLLAGALFAYITVRDTGDTEHPAARATPVSVETRTFESADRGFEVRVPTDLRAEPVGDGARFTSRDKDLVVTVGRLPAGSLRAAARGLLVRLGRSYPAVRVLGTKPEVVDGHRALTTFGQASNAAGVPLRFVVVTVPAGSRNYAITAFTGRDTDPAVVLPRVNAIVNGFHVRTR